MASDLLAAFIQKIQPFEFTKMWYLHKPNWDFLPQKPDQTQLKTQKYHTDKTEPKILKNLTDRELYK